MSDVYKYPFLYRVTLTNDSCFAKRPVAFQDDRFLTWEQISKEAITHIFSQTCTRCGKNHKEKTYVSTDVERGEPDRNGNYTFRNVYPGYKNSDQQELGL